jgi:hypothetical protein
MKENGFVLRQNMSQNSQQEPHSCQPQGRARFRFRSRLHLRSRTIEPVVAFSAAGLSSTTSTHQTDVGGFLNPQCLTRALTMSIEERQTLTVSPVGSERLNNIVALLIPVRRLRILGTHLVESNRAHVVQEPNKGI